MKLKKSYEYVIVGSGFGGAFAAYNLARAGKEVLVVERGKWVERDDSCWDEVRLHLVDPLYRGRTPIIVDQKRGKTDVYWPDDTVGGMSTFYGAAAFRMREEDFRGAPVGGGADRNADSAWPVGYNDLEPYYEEAERLQSVAGVMGEDVTEPRRSSEFPRRPPDISAPSRRIWDAAQALGLHPARIPLAIDFDGGTGRERCILCHTCDHYLCKICAKSDLSVVVLPEAVKKGAVVADNTRAVRINLAKGRVASVTLADQASGERHEIRVKRLILAAGALATPHLMLASGIEQEVPRGDLIGRNLMRHANGVVSALLPKKANPDMVFHKFVSITDFYHGDASDSKGPAGPWGIIQEIHSPERGVLRANTPLGLKSIATFANDYLLNLLCIAEDVPQYSNRVYLDLSEKDMFGMPALMVRHRYAERDLAARAALYRKARKILMKAGALPVYTFPIETFSHAFGTCAFGSSEKSSVLDPDCRVWGIKNLYVTDASVMPSGGSVNPSLTVAANALRVSAALARQ